MIANVAQASAIASALLASINSAIAAGNYLFMTESAPHPGAAKLLMELMTSKEGQKVLRQARCLPAHSEVPAEIENLRPSARGRKALAISAVAQREGSEDWLEIYQEMFRR